MKKLTSLFVFLAITGVSFPAFSASVAIDTVPVGNAGNPNSPFDGDSLTPGIQNYGAVSYGYHIGKYEVTNSQYAAFLNKVAANDPVGLYSLLMDNARGGITRQGFSGSYSYTVLPNMGDKPVNHVSWYDAIRFANWLHNGQPTGAVGPGTTETGAYTILGGTTTPSNADSITRQPSARWFLPSENEWYKAAYHKNNGLTDQYWDFPTGVLSPAPTEATASPTGDVSNPGTNVANYGNNADWDGQNGNVTTVGTAGPGSASAYNTYDQGGNVWEWNESLVSAGARSMRGGAYNGNAQFMLASTRNNSTASAEQSIMGFRVATFFPVPEPSLLALTYPSALLFALRRRRRG